MIPKFSSQTDMIGFIRALPKNANYTKMLADDFGIVAPSDAPEYQKEYLFKYLLQGTYKGKDQAELIKYAAEGVEALMQTLPHLKAEPTVEDVKPSAVLKATSSGKGRHKIPRGADGTAIFLEHRNVWIVFHGGKVVSTKKTEAACLDWYAKNYA